jgi:hypothetical protein
MFVLSGCEKHAREYSANKRKEDKTRLRMCSNQQHRDGASRGLCHWLAHFSYNILRFILHELRNKHFNEL